MRVEKHICAAMLGWQAGRQAEGAELQGQRSYQQAVCGAEQCLSAVQAAAKQAAKDAGVVEEDSDDEGGIIQVDEEMMRQREAAAALSAAMNAPPTQVAVALLEGEP